MQSLSNTTEVQLIVFISKGKQKYFFSLSSLSFSEASSNVGVIIFTWDSSVHVPPAVALLAKAVLNDIKYSVCGVCLNSLFPTKNTDIVA